MTAHVHDGSDPRCDRCWDVRIDGRIQPELVSQDGLSGSVRPADGQTGPVRTDPRFAREAHSDKGDE